LEDRKANHERSDGSQLRPFDRLRAMGVKKLWRTGWNGGRSKQVHGARCRVHGQHREMETNGWKIGMMELERWGRFPTDRLPYDGESA